MYFVSTVLTLLMQLIKGGVSPQIEIIRKLSVIKIDKMLQFLSTLLTSHTKFLSMTKSINLFNQFGGAAPSIDRTC